MPLRTLGPILALIASFIPVPDVLAQTKKAAAPFAMAPTAPLEPKAEIVSETNDHTQYRVEFNGIRKDRVPAYLYVPTGKGLKSPYPAVLLQYGIGGNKTSEYIVAIGKQFVARGFVVLTIDSPNCGERRKKESKTSAILGLLGGDQINHYCGDYSRAVDFLMTRSEVDRNRLGYVGISWGAITGITYVAHDPRIRAMGSMVGGGNFLGFYTPESAAKAASEGSTTSDPVVHVGKIAPRPLLFINVTKDQLILKGWADSLHKCAGENAKVVWLECDHYFRGVDRAEVCNSVVDFMTTSLPATRKR